MILQNLRYLAALARERHFSRAAGACGVTQPTLSAGIKQLEEELGLLIVRRGQRFEGLTAEGQRILEWGQRILADCESLEQEAAVLRGALRGRLRIGAIPTTLPALSLLTLPFSQLHPQVTISIHSLTSVDIQRGLDDFSLDAGLTYLDNEPLANVRTIPLYHERYLLFTPAGSPLADSETVSWGEVTGLPLCLLTPDMQNRRIIDGLFAAAGATVHPSHRDQFGADPVVARPDRRLLEHSLPGVPLSVRGARRHSGHPDYGLRRHPQRRAGRVGPRTAHPIGARPGRRGRDTGPDGSARWGPARGATAFHTEARRVIVAIYRPIAPAYLLRVRDRGILPAPTVSFLPGPTGV